MQIRHFVSNAAVHATKRQELLGCVTRHAFRFKFGAAFRSCQVLMLQLRYLSQTRTERPKPNGDYGSRTEHRQRQGLRIRHDPWLGQQQMQVKRASNERQRDTDQTSTRPQRNVNATSTVRQPNVNKASTEQQRVINPTIDSRRTARIQRLDEARAAIRDRWLRRVSVRPSQRVVLTPLCSTFA